MNRKVDKGKEAFDVVQLYKDEATGYKRGNFKEAWKGLENLYNSDDPTSKTELKKMYDRMEMKFGSEERPAKFISELRGLKKKLTKVGRIISEEDFKTDILSKLPPATKAGEDAPYSVIQQLIEKELKDDPDKMTVAKIQKLLTAKHKALFHGEAVDSEDTALFANQVKIQCWKCGDWGHKSYKCPNKNSSSKDGASGKNGEKKFGENKLTCLFCGKDGHSAQYCWDLQKRNQEKTEVGDTAFEVVLFGVEELEVEEEYWCVDGLEFFLVQDEDEESVDRELEYVADCKLEIAPDVKIVDNKPLKKLRLFQLAVSFTTA
jgi:hypothetical protein